MDILHGLPTQLCPEHISVPCLLACLAHLQPSVNLRIAYPCPPTAPCAHVASTLAHTNLNNTTTASTLPPPTLVKLRQSILLKSILLEQLLQVRVHPWHTATPHAAPAATGLLLLLPVLAFQRGFEAGRCLRLGSRAALGAQLLCCLGPLAGLLLLEVGPPCTGWQQRQASRQAGRGRPGQKAAGTSTCGARPPQDM